MQKIQQAYSQMQWDDAERYALQAQRLAPQAPETFYFLQWWPIRKVAMPQVNLWQGAGSVLRKPMP